MINWRELLPKYNCKSYLTSSQDLALLFKKYDNVWFCTGCSKTKGKYKDTSIPKYFYVSDRLLNFYKYCELNKFNYGILSDKYGIHLMDESLSFYDIHPSSLTDEQFKGLGKQIGQKANKLNIDCFVYYNPSPMMAVPYFKMLNFANIDFYFITKRISLNTQKTLQL